MNFKLNLTTFSKLIKTKLTFALIQKPYLCIVMTNNYGKDNRYTQHNELSATETLVAEAYQLLFRAMPIKVFCSQFKSHRDLQSDGYKACMEQEARLGVRPRTCEISEQYFRA